jgi:hypothetical protein
MFYEAIGALFQNAGEALSTNHGGDKPRDVRDQREFRQITSLLKRIGAIWPDLFASLDQEIAVYEATLADVAVVYANAGLPAPHISTPDSDPLKRYRQVLSDLDLIVEHSHASSELPWASATITRVRSGLIEASDIQGRLVDHALAV